MQAGRVDLMARLGMVYVLVAAAAGYVFVLRLPVYVICVR